MEKLLAILNNVRVLQVVLLINLGVSLAIASLTGKTCVALRGWYNDGKAYKSEDVGRLLR